jgi:hypothetical protein
MNAIARELVSEGNDSHSSAQMSPTETVAQLRTEIQELINALALLGIQRCSRCRQFFRSSEAGALFDYGELVCYACVPEWWRSVSAKVSVVDRERLEAKLSSWLRKYHQALVIKQDVNDKPDTNQYGFQMVVHCTECSGSGKLLEGERCRFCNGLGTIRVVTPE